MIQQGKDIEWVWRHRQSSSNHSSKSPEQRTDLDWHTKIHRYTKTERLRLHWDRMFHSRDMVEEIQKHQQSDLTDNMNQQDR